MLVSDMGVQASHVATSGRDVGWHVSCVEASGRAHVVVWVWLGAHAIGLGVTWTRTIGLWAHVNVQACILCVHYGRTWSYTCKGKQKPHPKGVRLVGVGC